MRTFSWLFLLSMTGLGVGGGWLAAAEFPQAEIANGEIRAKIYLPDGEKGYYRGTRFDWSGVVGGLEYKGHNYYGPWFHRIDPKVHDFTYVGPDIVAGLISSASGPVEEFGTHGVALGYAEAKPGGTFIKIGVGVLRKPDARSYDAYRLYDIVDPGKRTVHTSSDSIEFIHELADASSGYAYVYRKTLRLSKAKPEMVIEHSLKNTGRKAIQSEVYDHNFLILDNQPPGPDFTITVPFTIKTKRPPNPALAEVRGNRILYRKALEGKDTVAMDIQGFSDSAKDYDIRIDNSKRGAGIRVTADRPLSSLGLWSIRSTLCMEPFISMAIEPGSEFNWKYTYEYYTLPASTK